jgi:alkanesulfonate monooxygenase SsuD/methylene tetrahydromethanopterin reductase-like flavin-dependent oxidoreductase (luciferase family)
MDFEFGVLYSFRNPPQWSVDWKQCYEDHLADVVAMEQAGFDTIWLTEHHFSEDGYLPSLAVMSAAIAMRTSRATIGHAIIELPLHHPVALAEDLAVADILSGGRLRVGVGLGRMNDWRPSFKHEGLVFEAPLKAKERGQVLEEYVEILRKCWRNEPFRHEGQRFRFPEIDVTPKPVQPNGPPLWFGVGDQSVKALDRAVRMGDGWVGGAGGLTKYLDKLREQGREAEAGNAVVFVNHYPADDPDAMEAKYADHLNYIPRWYNPDGPVTSPGWGSGRGSGFRWFVKPEVLAQELDELRARGATGGLWFAPIYGVPGANSRAIFTSLITDVKPLMKEVASA